MRILLSFLFCCCALFAQLDSKKVKVLILSGINNHDWRASTPYLKQLLLDSGRFDVRVAEWPSGLSAKTLEPFDAILVDYCGPRWGEPTERAIEAFVKSGKGMIVVHAASYPFGDAPILGDHMTNTGKTEPAWMEYRKMVGGYWSKKEAPVTGHGARHSFQVRFADRAHPIAQGLEESFWQTDELYHSMRMMPGAKVLASALDEEKYKGTGKAEPILWTVEYGRGRVFQTVLGHNIAAMQSPGFKATLLRGSEWAASGKVTLPAAAKPVDTRPRVLVITGGHAYETSFYSLFDGMRWDHAESNEAAFKKDIRAKYDVVLMYDMQRTISDAAKKNLQAYLESGKGLVVLHHAIVSYNDWEWWCKEVVGGSYRQKAEGDQPASTWLHDQEMFVSVTAKHPVAGDIGPMQLIDETYGKLWISKDVKVLMETTNPNTNGPVVWVSPYPKSRVVAILLGHDHLAHEHAGFRQLIRNAVNWTASKN